MPNSPKTSNEKVIVVVPVVFRGVVKVMVPASVPSGRRRPMAEKLAIARMHATDQNPDEMDLVAFDSYTEEFELSKEIAAVDWDGSKIDGVCGSWSVDSNERKSLTMYQEQVHGWALECFGPVIVYDKLERAKRVVEEALELGQSVGLDMKDAVGLVTYVFGREAGKPGQEIAGVLVTTLVMAASLSINAANELEREISRINEPETFHKIRNKQVSKEVAGIGTAADINQTPKELGQ